MDLTTLLREEIKTLLAEEIEKAVQAALDRRERTPRWISLIAAARRAHVGHRAVQEAIANGTLHATKHPGKNKHGEYHILPADLDAWNESRLEKRGLLPV